jgi:8-oxo-dGTP pyrophosphatase MutT (NUDIX family)
MADGIDRLGVICVVVVTDCVLIVRRALHDAFRPGCNELPGGGLDPDEKITDGLRRELSEETGLRDPMHTEPLLRYDATYGSTVVRHFAFLILHASRDMRLHPDEHMEHVWCPIDDADALARLGIGEDAEPWILEEARRRLRIRRESAHGQSVAAPRPKNETEYQEHPTPDAESEQGGVQ